MEQWWEQRYLCKNADVYMKRQSSKFIIKGPVAAIRNSIRHFIRALGGKVIAAQNGAYASNKKATLKYQA